MRASARRHPWVVRIPINGLPIMPHEVAWFEHALACLHDTGLTEARKASVVMLLAGYVRNLATTEADIEAAIRASRLSPGEWMSSYAGLLKRLTDGQRFPALNVFLAAGVFDAADDPDDEFVFGLDRILNGIEVLVTAGTGKAGVLAENEPGGLRFAQQACGGGVQVDSLQGHTPFPPPRVGGVVRGGHR